LCRFTESTQEPPQELKKEPSQKLIGAKAQKPKAVGVKYIFIESSAIVDSSLTLVDRTSYAFWCPYGKMKM
jgi:hypothetical protein